jgi:alanine racemase
MQSLSQQVPLRSAWIEINLELLRRNFAIINQDKPEHVRFLSVVKDDAYGHGAFTVAQAALAAGAEYLAVSTLEEAMRLRERNLTAPILLLGQRQESELAWCVRHDLTCAVHDEATARALARLAAGAEKRAPVHIKLNTGMNRYGVRWTEALSLVEQILVAKSLTLEGVFSHFAMSDETDKTFALVQWERFQSVRAALKEKGVAVKYFHLCNSGGFLDLPQAHFDMVRLGLLPIGVYPSQVCRRIPGIAPVMALKTRIAAIQQIEEGETVGYGLRYKAPARRRIAVLPLGYGDGYPRIRNQGEALVQGRRAPIVGTVAMDAMTIDVTDVPQAGLWDEAVLMGRQGQQEISVHEIARHANTVSYHILAGWRTRLPRLCLSEK